MTDDIAKELRALATHLEGLDSGSGEAKMLRRAAEHIEQRAGEIKEGVCASFDAAPDALACKHCGYSFRDHYASHPPADRAEVVERKILNAEMLEDKNVPRQYRVEAIDDDGGCEVAIFSGPNALFRAQCFAGGGKYYDGWADRTAAGY